MDTTKISVEEIEALREKAETEREMRAKVRSAIATVKLGLHLPEKCQIEILKRGRKGEIRELLKAYTGKDCTPAWGENQPMMSPVAQIYIYENWKDTLYMDLRKFMIEKVPYTDELAKRLIDEGEYNPTQELSPNLEEYFLEYKLKHPKCKESVSGYRFLTWFFTDVVGYLQKYTLSPKATLYLVMNYLKPEPISEEYVKVCNEVFKKYIQSGHILDPQAERALIATGNHEAIMMYIRNVTGGLKEEQSLLTRGNREEVTAYFERYATL